MYLGHYGDSSLSKSVTISCSNRSVELQYGNLYYTGNKTSPNIKKITGYFKVDNLFTNNVTKSFEKRSIWIISNDSNTIINLK